MDHRRLAGRAPIGAPGLVAVTRHADRRAASPTRLAPAAVHGQTGGVRAALRLAEVGLELAGGDRPHAAARWLVDELHLIVGSVVVGGGTPIFGTDSAPRLRLLGAQTWDGSDNVLVRYATTASDS